MQLLDEAELESFDPAVYFTRLAFFGEVIFATMLALSLSAGRAGPRRQTVQASKDATRGL